MKMLGANALEDKRKDLMIFLEEKRLEEATAILNEVKYSVFSTNLPKFLADCIERIGGAGLKVICEVWDLDLVDLTQGRPTIGNFMYRFQWVNENLTSDLGPDQLRKVGAVVRWLSEVYEMDSSNQSVLNGFGDFFSLKDEDGYCNFNGLMQTIEEWSSALLTEVE